MTHRTIQAMIFAVIMGALSSPAYAFDRTDSAWAGVLKNHTENGRVDYAALKKSRAELDGYLREISRVTEEEYAAWPRNAQIAFWINAYNAFTIQAIIDHYPVKSIKNIPNVWGAKRYEILGQKRSLDGIEHEILRKQFKEPRVHFALVCASIGCPTLKSEPYAGEELNSQLDSQVRDFLSDASKVTYDEKSDTLKLSPIFKWYGVDFKDNGGILLFISNPSKHYLPLEMEGKLSPTTKISWLGYDWDLNDKK